MFDPTESFKEAFKKGIMAPFIATAAHYWVVRVVGPIPTSETHHIVARGRSIEKEQRSDVFPVAVMGV